MSKSASDHIQSPTRRTKISKSQVKLNIAGEGDGSVVLSSSDKSKLTDETVSTHSALDKDKKKKQVICI